MIIDASKAHDGAGHRRHTAVGAIAEVTKSILPGEYVDVTRAVDQLGDEIPIAKIRAHLNKIGGPSTFITRKLPPDVGLIRIYRRAGS